MHIIHLSAECFPAAKVGGMADVVGSLPKYLNQLGERCEVVMPKYQTEWIGSQRYEVVFEGNISMGFESYPFSVQKLISDALGFPLFVIDIPGRFDRPGIYIDPRSGHGYWDEFERFLSFQIAALEWMNSGHRPDVVHCHDHHTGLVPFMLSNCNRYKEISEIPTVFTVHNAEYHGSYELDNYKLLPAFNIQKLGLLDWDGKLNSIACGLKCAWQITTVSEAYMEELAEDSNGLEELFRHERQKSVGILNGIDDEVWNPEADKLLEFNYNYRSRKKGKRQNKTALCSKFGLKDDLPVVAFIGRLVREKGADLLPDLIRHFLESDTEVNFVLLGTGDPELHQIFNGIQNDHFGYFDATLEYNEKLAHQIYASADFILMPSRVEPCGLNQMFAMRYGTVPIVRAVGGLKDTVIDISQGGYGITFEGFTLEEAVQAINSAIGLYHDETKFAEVVAKIMKLDFSWKRSANRYVELYNTLGDM